MEQLQLENENNKQLYKSLLKDYEKALYQLAEARLHIDRLRFGAHVNIHKHYRLTHSIEKNERQSSVDSVDFSSTKINSEEKCSTVRQSEVVKQIAELQERLHSLHEKTQNSEISLDEVQSELMDIHDMHQKLATDLAAMMDAADESEETNDPESRKMKNELMILAQQLQDFITLLQDKEEAILNTTMKRRRSSMSISPNDQQAKNGSEIIEDKHAQQNQREGWIDQIEKDNDQFSPEKSTQEINHGKQLNDILMTPPYTPLVKDMVLSGSPGQHHTISTNDKEETNSDNIKYEKPSHSSPSFSRTSKIPVYNNNNNNRSRNRLRLIEAEESTCSGLTSDSPESCPSNTELHPHRHSVPLRNDLKKNRNPLSDYAKRCPSGRHAGMRYHPTSKSESDIKSTRGQCCSCCRALRDGHLVGNNDKDTTKLSQKIPTITIDDFTDSKSPHLSQPSKHTIDKSISAMPKMIDKGIQVNPSCCQIPRTLLAKSRRKKICHKLNRGGTRPSFDTYLSSDDSSHVLLIDSKEFLKKPYDVKRKNRHSNNTNSSFKMKEPSRERGYYDPTLNRKEYQKKKIRTKKRRPIYYHVMKTTGQESSLESTKDSLSSSDSQSTITSSTPAVIKNKKYLKLRPPATKSPIYSTGVQYRGYKFDAHEPHSDTLIPSRPIPIPYTSKQNVRPFQIKDSVSLDEAIDLAERLKKSSKRMNTVLKNDLPRYSV